MSASLFIACRYLKAKKRHNAVQIVSKVSAAAVAVVTAAMVCVLSVMNGFGVVIEGMFSAFDPDIRIVAEHGKYFMASGETFDRIRQHEAVAVYAETIEETALVEYGGKQIPTLLKGVDDSYQALTQIDSIVCDGSYSVFDGAFERAVMGQGLAAQLGTGAHFVGGLHIYAPQRTERVNLMRPDESFRQATCFMSGIFAVNQVKYDDQMMIVSLPLAQQLFDYVPHQVTAIELRLREETDVELVQLDFREVLGEGYKVLNRYEQQADFYRILHVEKWLTALLLSFILFIAAFNLTSSLTMLILDKREDIQTMRYLGADQRTIQRVFLYEGWLIAAIGALIGLVVGVAVCLVQEHFGLIKLGNGTDYVLSAYPVSINWGDIGVVWCIVMGVGFLSAWYPTRRLDMVENRG